MFGRQAKPKRKELLDAFVRHLENETDMKRLLWRPKEGLLSSKYRCYEGDILLNGSSYHLLLYATNDKTALTVLDTEINRFQLMDYRNESVDRLYRRMLHAEPEDVRAERERLREQMLTELDERKSGRRFRMDIASLLE